MKKREPVSKEVSLRDAVWKYATAEQRAAYKAAIQRKPAGKYLKTDPAAAEIKELFEGIRDLGEIWSSQNEAYSPLVKNLCNLIENGDLVATGVQILPELGRARCKIPAFLFDDPCLTLPSGRLKNLKHQFDRVRVGLPMRPKRSSRGPQKRSTNDADPPLATPPQSKRGRPAVDSFLDQVVGQLDRDGQLMRVTRKEQVNRVREQARKQFPHIFTTDTRPSRTKILAALVKVGHGRDLSPKSL